MGTHKEREKGGMEEEKKDYPRANGNERARDEICAFERSNVRRNRNFGAPHFPPFEFCACAFEDIYELRLVRRIDCTLPARCGYVYWSRARNTDAHLFSIRMILPLERREREREKNPSV